MRFIDLLFQVALALCVADLVFSLQRLDRAMDVPEKQGTCVLYESHHHGDGSRSYQLTCSVPVPDSILVYPARTR